MDRRRNEARGRWKIKRRVKLETSFAVKQKRPLKKGGLFCFFNLPYGRTASGVTEFRVQKAVPRSDL